MQNVNVQKTEERTRSEETKTACKKKQSKVLLVIPAYNEAENLPRVVADIAGEQGLDYVIVSDGSTDGTVELCRARGYNYIALPVNLGLAGCFQTGMKYAYERGYSYAVQFDGDGQHRAEDVKVLFDKMEQEGPFDLVLGSRFLNGKKGRSMRELGSRLITGAIFLTTGRHVTDPTCGLRMYNREMMRLFAYQLNYGPEPDTVSYLMKNGARVAEAPIVVKERQAGESYLKPLNAIRYMSRMLVSILVIQNFRRRHG